MDNSYLNAQSVDDLLEFQHWIDSQFERDIQQANFEVGQEPLPFGV